MDYGQSSPAHQDPADAVVAANAVSWERSSSASSPSAIKPGPAIPVEKERIMDWAIWTAGKGVTEGALTKSVSLGF